MSDETPEVGEPGSSVATIDDEKRELSRHPEQLPMLPGELKPHPTPRQYVLIAVVLVIITGFEVATSYLDGDVNSRLLVLVLFTMAAVKFFLVVAWYMHLRTDLRIFRRMFVGGLLLAGAVYLIMLTMLHVFNTGVHAR
jgi:cytochrome c oxidase subunit 4